MAEGPYGPLTRAGPSTSARLTQFVANKGLVSPQEAYDYLSGQQTRSPWGNLLRVKQNLNEDGVVQGPCVLECLKCGDVLQASNPARTLKEHGAACKSSKRLKVGPGFSEASGATRMASSAYSGGGNAGPSSSQQSTILASMLTLCCVVML